MQRFARDQYLDSQVATATPQRLRLLLLDAAIRSAHQALAGWDGGRHDDALAAVTRCREIIGELLSGVRPDGSKLTNTVLGIYVFLMQRVTEAQLYRDRERLNDVVKVLETERETWRLVCEQMPDAPPPELRSLPRAEVTAGNLPAIPARGAEPSRGGFMLDA